MKNKNFMKCTVLVILFLVLSTSLYAASSSLVIDECGTIDTDQKASLQVLANQIEEEFKVAAYVVLVNDPDMTNVEVKLRLRESCVKIPGTESGWGMLNVDRLLKV